MSQIEPLSLEEFLARLEHVTRVGDNWQAVCPAHEDRRASLSVRAAPDDGRILLNCHAGCTFEAILAVMGLEAAQLFPATVPQRLRDSAPAAKIVAVYDYRDFDGQLRFQVCRLDPKGFRQRRPDPDRLGHYLWDMKGVEHIPYRLPDLKGHATVYVVEGEKDVEALWALGLPATTNVGGAGKMRSSDMEALRDAGVSRLIIVPDNDAPGLKHAAAVEALAKGFGLAATIVSLISPGFNTPKGDVSDWLACGYTKEELEQRAAEKLYLVPTTMRPLIEPEPPIVYTAPEDDPAFWVLSDYGAAEAFAYRHRDHVRYDHRQRYYLVWDQHFWKPDATREVCRLVVEHARQWQRDAIVGIKDLETRAKTVRFALKLERRGGVENTLDLAQTVLPIADDGQRWDEHAFLLGCPNGILDLRAGQLRDGRPEDRITIQTGVPYQPEATCPRWITFLEEVFEGDKEVIDFVHLALGYSLTADMREQCFFMCVGTGSNGKSTFLSTLDYVWGAHCYTTAMRTFTNQPGGEGAEWDLAELAARRLVIAAETKTRSEFNETAIKSFTGGEKINAQRKYGHPFEYLPTGKIWIGVNHTPRVRDDSHAFWRRVRMVMFNRTFSGSTDNRDLRDALRAEGSGILTWAVQGALAWQARGLTSPAAVRTATDAYQESEDPLHDFINERISPDKGKMVSVQKAYVIYKEFAKSQGLPEKDILPPGLFTRSMSRHYTPQRSADGRRFVDIVIKDTHTDLLTNNDVSDAG